MIEWVVERLISIIPAIDKAAKDKREIADNALQSISAALTETSLYVAKYSKTGKRDEAIQEELARLWGKAAIPLRHIDQELSQICEYKSEYWVDPCNWNLNKTNGLAIDLESVREKYRAKLN